MLKLDILYEFGENHIAAAGVSILSLLENNRHFDEILIYILGDKLSGDSEDKLRSLAAGYHRQLTFLDRERLLHILKRNKVPVNREGGGFDLRLYISQILDGDIGRILYLQVNTIISGKLDGLAELDMEGHPVAMALDALVRRHKRQLGFARDEYYYNAGVILFDMNVWRSERCMERVINHIKNVRYRYPLTEQDLLNVVLKGQILKLPPEYSLQPVIQIFSRKEYRRVFTERGFYSENELIRSENAPVIHLSSRFTGEYPWNKNNVHPDNDLFDLYLRKSAWAGYNKKRAVKSLVFRIEKLLYGRIPQSLFIRLFRIAYERSIRRANSDSLKNGGRKDYIWDRL